MGGGLPIWQVSAQFMKLPGCLQDPSLSLCTTRAIINCTRPSQRTRQKGSAEGASAEEWVQGEKEGPAVGTCVASHKVCGILSRSPAYLVIPHREIMNVAPGLTSLCICKKTQIDRCSDTYR